MGKWDKRAETGSALSVEGSAHQVRFGLENSETGVGERFINEASNELYHVPSPFLGVEDVVNKANRTLAYGIGMGKCQQKNK